MSTLKYRGAANFRSRIICSTLSGRPVVITEIRALDEEPGLKDFEGSFLRLVEKMTNGCQIASDKILVIVAGGQVEINETGTMLRYKPGIIIGGRISHDCGCSRAISWFLEGVLPLAVFSKEATSLALTGITNDDVDMSVDNFKAVTLPLLSHFGVDGVNFKIKRRGLPPSGGGAVEFFCPIIRELRPLNLVDPGLIKRVRGVAFCAKISPQFSNRVVASGRALLNRLLPDVYIYTDHYSGAAGGLSPGYGMTLVAESTTGCMLSVDEFATEGMVPEDLGHKGSITLLEEVRKGGCVDSSHQPLVLLLMVLCPEDVGRVRMGQLSQQAIATLRLLRDVFGVTFKLKADLKTTTTMLSCLGIGYKNFARRVT